MTLTETVDVRKVRSGGIDGQSVEIETGPNPKSKSCYVDESEGATKN